MIHCTCGHLLVESESSQHFSQWRLDALSPSRTSSSRRGNHMVLGTVKLRHRKSTMWPTTRGRDVSKEITKEFTIVFHETQYIVIRNSKLAGPSRSASGRPLQPCMQRRIPEISKTLVSHIKQIRSHNHEPPPPRIRRRTCRTYSFSTVSKVAPFFFQFFMVELGHVQKLVELMRIILFFSKICLLQKVSFAADSNLLQPTGCVNSTPHTSLFLLHNTRAE